MASWLQDGLALAIVAFVVAIGVIRRWRGRRQANRCPGCAGCPATNRGPAIPIPVGITHSGRPGPGLKSGHGDRGPEPAS